MPPRLLVPRVSSVVAPEGLARLNVPLLARLTAVNVMADVPLETVLAVLMFNNGAPAMVTALIVSPDVVLFWLMPVTLLPIWEIVTRPPPEPPLLIAPVLFAVPVTPTVPAPLALNVMSPVFEKLPLIAVLLASWFQITFMEPV